MECFNPFIPTNDKDSGLPVGIFYWHLTNEGSSRVEASLMASLQNIAGVDSFGQNLNAYRDDGAIQLEDRAGGASFRLELPRARPGRSA